MAGRRVGEKRKIKKLLDVLWAGEWGLEHFELLFVLACRQANRESWVMENGDEGLKGELLRVASEQRRALREARMSGARRAVEVASERLYGEMLGDARRLQDGVLSSLRARVEEDGVDVFSWSKGELDALRLALGVAARVEDRVLGKAGGDKDSGQDSLKGLGFLRELEAELEQGDSLGDS